MFIFQRVFWGFVILLIGALFLIQNVLGISIPIASIFWPVIIILIGLNIIFSSRRHPRDRRSFTFEEGETRVEGSGEYNAVFGRGVFDLTKLKVEKNTQINTSAVFGNAIVKISSQTPIKISASGAFGEVRLPNGNSVSFGENIYTTKSFDSSKPYASIKANAVFGRLEVIEE